MYKLKFFIFFPKKINRKINNNNTIANQRNNFNSILSSDFSETDLKKLINTLNLITNPIDSSRIKMIKSIMRSKITVPSNLFSGIFSF